MATVEYPSLLPFAISEPKWDALVAGGDGDNYYYSSGGVTSGSDGIAEIQVFPQNNWNGNGLPPGHYRSLQIGPQSGDAVLRRQIDMGPSSSDFAYHGGPIQVGMQLPGKTGVNASIKTAFNGGNANGREYAGIFGKTRFMPIYNAVSGNDANALFTIEEFVTVRIMYLNMTGGNKMIVIQPVNQVEYLSNFYLTR